MATAAKSKDKSDAKAASLRAHVIATARAMSARGLSPGRSGNVSARYDDGMLITPSGLPYETLVPDDVVFVSGEGAAHGARLPSSEWRFHLAAYAARLDTNAIVHAHSMHATVLACAHRPIPAFHYMVAVAGGADIPLVPYATFGTAELSRHVASGLAARDACLMANHGQIAIGRSLESALELATEVETLAEQYIKVLQLGPAQILPADEMAVVIEKFKTYGQKAQR
jgi:L-fuculose-phosphate aldolase